MPLCRVNVDGGTLSEPDQVRERLRSALAATAPRAPVVVLIHGYRFSPAFTTHDPHSHILALDPGQSDRKARSWPRALGVGLGDPEEPLCIALGWEARGTLWQVYRRAAETGVALARLVSILRSLAPARPVDVIAHSLGCRVALAALPHLPAGALGRALLLAPAELRTAARGWLDCPAGRSAEVLAVTSRANAPYDRALEWLIAPHRIGERTLGAGPGAAMPNWHSLRIDDPATRAALETLGFPVAAPDRLVCHWSVYLQRGLFPLYRAVLDRRVPLAALCAQPARPTIWSRLGQLVFRPLSPVGKQPS